VREIYEVSGWFEAGQTAYFTRPFESVDDPQRIEFVGRIAPDAMRKRYLFKSVREYFVPGNSNPIQYINC